MSEAAKPIGKSSDPMQSEPAKSEDLPKLISPQRSDAAVVDASPGAVLAGSSQSEADASNVIPIAKTELPGAKADQPSPVSTLVIGGLDERGNTIKYIYAIDPDYAVYYSRLENAATSGARSHPLKRLAALFGVGRADRGYEREGVQVQLASDPAKRQQQRRSLLQLGTARAKLQALLSGWPRRQSYDSSIASALQLALDGEGKAEQALATLTDAQNSIQREREVAGRGQYAAFALIWGAVLFALLQVLKHNAFHGVGNFWLGAQAGLIGAIFSIAIGIRSRTVALDTNVGANLCDSLLRLVIGAISGGALLLLFSTGLMPRLQTVQGSMDGTALTSPAFVLLLGIIAGFVERMVPGMLDDQGKKLGGNTVDAPSRAETLKIDKPKPG